MLEKTFKITVTFEARDDGGLRAYSDDVPGLVLSHKDVDGVLSDVETAMETILSDLLSVEVEVRALGDIRSLLEQRNIVARRGSLDRPTPGRKEYVAYCH